ncbi:hypothetical protein JDV02_008295 [Purpureocillium takamizusanense]|uniref:Uncharacterized protein n=1 Tax=Purpureocillium takamizusanense TaxID=2060973 RepID=A0A9Q8QJW4_9HYPO|nr:uncharacterized protein JDV02_008295 [Purpureocillium takamizusanense]UNI22404.1 hypothetical protein JDV02_008295 [Purpureocillium takamizusanense]
MALMEPIDAIGRLLAILFAGPAPTNAERIQYGYDIIGWYENPVVTEDEHAMFQLRSVRFRWKATIPKDADAETLATMYCLWDEIEEAFRKTQRPK